MAGPQLAYCDELHAQKYRGPGETFREVGNRLANVLKDKEEDFYAFRDIYLGMRFLPGGRVQSGVGSSRAVTAFNCFVSGIIEDTLLDGDGSIQSRAGQALQTMRMGGGIGYDWSTLRPRGATIKKLQSKSSGPVAWMSYYSAGGQAIASSGHRRGAQMGVLRIDHPDIMEFIHVKQNADKLTGFNLSVGVTDAFMEALRTGKPFDLVWEGETYNTVDPGELWDAMMRGTWDWAEPGVLFIDRINQMNNLWYCEYIAATNPCGEQPLPPFGACLLGSFNLPQFLTKGESDNWAYNLGAFKADIPHVVRAMDNVIDRTIYPLYEQEKEAKAKRRIGLGVAGLANAIETMGHPYGSEEFIAVEETILSTLKNEAYRASALLAKEKGPFKLFNRDKYMQGKFIQTLDADVQELIYKYGIRNSHLTSIAPTGTIATSADNISGGIEPVFALEMKRTVIEFEGERTETLPDYAYRVYGTKGKTADQVTVQEHLAVLLAAQKHVDSAVSKTCNVPPSTNWEEFKKIYVDAYYGGAKGCTTYRTDCKRGAVLTAVPEGAACTIDDMGRKTCAD